MNAQKKESKKHESKHGNVIKSKKRKWMKAWKKGKVQKKTWTHGNVKKSERKGKKRAKAKEHEKALKYKGEWKKV